MLRGKVKQMPTPKNQRRMRVLKAIRPNVPIAKSDTVPGSGTDWVLNKIVLGNVAPLRLPGTISELMVASGVKGSVIRPTVRTVGRVGNRVE